MAKLNNIKRQIFEKLFDMSSGYVLDFSNKTFYDFIKNSVNIDIRDDKYLACDYSSGSKANRLRCFWDKESDEVVYKLLKELLTYYEQIEVVLMSSYKIKKVFEHHLVPVEYYISNIYNDTNDELHNCLMDDLKTFKNNDLENFKKDNPFEDCPLDDELLNLFSKKIRYEISKDRIKYLINSKKPYDNTDFKDLTIDGNQLIPINDFECKVGGFESVEGLIYKDNRYCLCLPHYKSNSNKWIQENLIKAKDNDEFNIKIRLDPLANNFLYNIQKMVVYGQNIKWHDLVNLNEETHSQFVNVSHGKITDLVWKPNGNELHFTCEELPNNNKCEIMGSRYFHAIYDKDLDIVTHCDGSLRIYDKNELINRKKYHVRHSNSRKMGKRAKIFQVDGYIPTKCFTSFVNSFYLWNYDINQYFKNLTR